MSWATWVEKHQAVGIEIVIDRTFPYESTEKPGDMVHGARVGDRLLVSPSLYEWLTNNVRRAS